MIIPVICLNMISVLISGLNCKTCQVPYRISRQVFLQILAQANMCMS